MIAENERSPVTQLRNDNIGAVLGEEDHPIFIACLRKDKDYKLNRSQLEKIAAYFGDDITICFALDDLLPYFSERYGVGGTPTFLMIRQGELLDTMLGKESMQSLIEFCKVHVPGRDQTGMANQAKNAGDVSGQGPSLKRKNIIQGG